MRMSRIDNKYILVLVMISICTLLFACSAIDEVKEAAQTNTGQAMERLNVNIDMVNRLVDAGYISTNQGKLINQEIRDTMTALSVSIATGDLSKVEVTYYREQPGEKDDLAIKGSDVYAFKDIVRNTVKGSKIAKNVEGRADPSSLPITKTQGYDSKDLANVLVMVLKEGITDGLVSISKIFTDLEKGETSNIDNYFKPSENFLISLPDLFAHTKENRVFRSFSKEVTEGKSWYELMTEGDVDEELYREFIGAIDKVKKSNMNLGEDYILYEQITVTYLYEDPENEDNILSATVTVDIPTAAIRLKEVNPNITLIVGEIQGEVNSTNMASKFQFVPAQLGKNSNSMANRGNKMLLLEYPMSYVSKVRATSNSLYTIEYEQTSDILVNIKTGDLYRLIETDELDEDGNRIKKDIPVQQQLSKLYNITDDSALNSFVMTGSSTAYIGDYIKEFSIKDENGSGKNVCALRLPEDKNVATTAIVLRDYMEIVPMSGIVAGEDWIVTGRRYRLDQNIFKNEFAKDNAFLNYVSYERGLTGYSLSLYDILDSRSTKFVYSKINKTSEVDADELRDLFEENDSEKMRILNMSEIDLTTRFPSRGLGTDDVAIESKLPSRIILYGIKTDSNVFSTAFYNGWLKSESSVDSIIWWNKWLDANKFIYSIDIGEIESFLMKHFSSEVGLESGKLIFNMDTIGKIQESLEKKDMLRTLSMIRIIFVVLGIVIIVYSLLLPIGWLFDTNISFGPKMLSIMTFGNWVSIHKDDKENALVLNDDKTNYMTIGNVVVSSIILSMIGCMIIAFDILGILVSIINMFSSIGNTIGRIFFN